MKMKHMKTLEEYWELENQKRNRIEQKIDLHFGGICSEWK